MFSKRHKISQQKLITVAGSTYTREQLRKILIDYLETIQDVSEDTFDKRLSYDAYFLLREYLKN